MSLRQFVECPRAKSARIEFDLLVTGRPNSGVKGHSHFVAGPSPQLCGRQLDAGQITEVPNSKVAGDAERAKRRLGPLDAGRSRPTVTGGAR